MHLHLTAVNVDEAKSSEIFSINFELHPFINQCEMLQLKQAIALPNNL